MLLRHEKHQVCRAASKDKLLKLDERVCALSPGDLGENDEAPLQTKTIPAEIVRKAWPSGRRPCARNMTRLSSQPKPSHRYPTLSSHEVEAVRIPRFGKPKKKRVSAMLIVCTKCLCTTPSVAKISKSLCVGGAGRNRNSSRRKFLARLKEAGPFHVRLGTSARSASFARAADLSIPTLLLSSRARVTLQLPGISTRRKACVPSFPLPSVKAGHPRPSGGS